MTTHIMRLLVFFVLIICPVLAGADDPKPQFGPEEEKVAETDLTTPAQPTGSIQISHLPPASGIKPDVTSQASSSWEGSGFWKDSGISDILWGLGAFLLVLGLLLLFLKFLGRGRRGFKGSKTFVLRGTMALDSRRYLAAVEIDHRLLVVGVTPDRLTSLGQWSFKAAPEQVSDQLAEEHSTNFPKTLAEQEFSDVVDDDFPEITLEGPGDRK